MDIKIKDNPELRLGITQLEYIESTGTQYIDTGIVANKYTIGFDVTFMFTQPQDNYPGVIGAYTVDSKTGYWGGIGISSNKIQLINFYGNYTDISNYSLNTKYHIKCNINSSRGIYIDDVYKIDYPTGSQDFQSNFFIFAGNTYNGNQSTRYALTRKIRIYSYKVYKNYVLAGEFVPARDDNGVICMYDLVSKSFFYNQGTGDFIAGPIIGYVGHVGNHIVEKITTLYHNNCLNVDGYSLLKLILNRSLNNQPEIKYNFYKDSQLWNGIKTAYPDLIPYTDACHTMLGDICTCITPGPMQIASSCNDFINEEGFTRLEYIESTGTQWIDTGIKPNQNTRVCCKFKYNTVSSGSSPVFGIYQPDNRYAGVNFDGTNIVTSSTGTTYTEVILSNGNNTDIHIIDYNNNNVILYDNVNKGSTSNIIQNTLNLYMFCQNRLGDKYYYKGRIYYFKLYNNNVLALDLIPVIDDNNVVCMYDTVSETFFYNQGTGNFVAGPVIGIGDNITDYIPDCTYDETQIIPLNRVRVDIGNVSAPLQDIMPFAGMAGFNDDYGTQPKPRLVGTLTINNWYDVADLATAQANFDGLTIVPASNMSYETLSATAIHLLSTSVPSTAPNFITSDITKIYIGTGSSSSDDSTLKASFAANSNWSSYSSLLDTYYNYLHE